MNQQIVFITGSASGVGLHLTERFYQAGYCVVATDIDYDTLKLKASERQWAEHSVLLRKLDITSRSQWKKTWQAAIDRWQGIDVMCNVAGYLKPGLIHQSDPDEIDRHFDINVKGLILGSQLAAKQMVQQGSGHIINIASLAGIAPIPGIALYSASKFAVRGFSLALAQELSPLNVDVTVICPDAIDTPMLALQEHYEEAALTFSGSSVLTVEDIGDAIFDKALKNKPMEIDLPIQRGLMAKVASAAPGISSVLGSYLGKRGKAEQEKRKLARDA